MTKFERIVQSYMPRLINDLGITLLDSAAVFGNGGHESGGFQKLQEIKPTVKGSRGGFGWFQWTGPRRRQFEAFCKAQKLNTADDEANYLFLVHELRGAEKAALGAMARCRTLDTKTVAFEQTFERAGVKHYGSRKAWALKALHAYEAINPPPTHANTVAPDPSLRPINPPSAPAKRPEPAIQPVPAPVETRPEISLPKPQPEIKTMSETKRWWQSKSVWGALLTLVSFSGLLGISFDADTMTLHINLSTLAGQVLTAGVPGGAILSWFGRIAAKKAIG